MKRNSSALAAACVVAAMALAGCAGNGGWSGADAAAPSDQDITLEHGRHGNPRADNMPLPVQQPG